MAKRTWNAVMGEIIKLKIGETRRRWITASKDKAFVGLRERTLLETRAEEGA